MGTHKTSWKKVERNEAREAEAERAKQQLIKLQQAMEEKKNQLLQY